MALLPEVELTTDEQKVSYGFGLQFGDQLRRNSFDGRGYFDQKTKAVEPQRQDMRTIILADQKDKGGEVFRNWSASLIDIGDGVGCLEFHSALQPEMNPIDGAILDQLRQSLEEVGKRGMKGLVISHQSTHFSAGANLAPVPGSTR